MVVTSEYKGDPLLQILDKNFLGNPSIIFFFSVQFLNRLGKVQKKKVTQNGVNR